MFKVNNRKGRKRCEICSKITLKTPERCCWRCSVVFVVNFEHIHSYLRDFYCWFWVSKCYLGVTVSSSAPWKPSQIHDYHLLSPSHQKNLSKKETGKNLLKERLTSVPTLEQPCPIRCYSSPPLPNKMCHLTHGFQNTPATLVLPLLNEGITECR